MVLYSGDVRLAANSAGDVVVAWRSGGGHTINQVFAAAYQDPGAAASGTLEVSARQLLINQRITQAAIRRVNALQAKVDGVPAPSGGTGEPSKVTLSVDQLLINQRIAQAAVRRVNALTALINGEPAPSPRPGEPGRLTLSARQLLINQRISQAAIRRVNALAERIPDLPVPRLSIGSPGLDRVIAVATAPRKMRITVVQRGSATQGATVALVLPPPIRDARFVVPGSTVGAEGIVAEGTFYGFYVTVEPPDDD